MTCDPAGAALAAPPPAATPAISVITPTAMAILVVHRIRIRVPFALLFPFAVSGLSPRKPAQRDINQEPDESREGAPVGQRSNADSATV